jgi:2-phospho-L-lactate guanylyltransferase
VALAQREAVARGACAFLTVPGDVPALAPGEVAALVAALGGARGVALTPSASGLGTNGALLAPPDAMPLRFGEPSFEAHLATARARGLSPVIVRLPGLGLDVDGPDDLGRVLAAAPRTRAAALLRSWDVPARSGVGP